jgi:chromosome segregation ATPase
MSFGLEALFDERLEVFPAEPAEIMHSDPSQFKAVIKSLVRERDDLQAQVNNNATTIEHLESRIYAKVAADADLPVDIARRLNRLESECLQLRQRNTKLNDNLRAAESETATLRDTIVEKSQKMNGANKKTKNAKEVAMKVEEKAKGVVNDRQQRIASQRKMKQERNEAQAALSQERKIAEDLRAEIKAEQSGEPHLRDTEGKNSNYTTMVVPVTFRIRRADYQRAMTRLQRSEKYLLERAQDWYETWKAKLQEERQGDEGDCDDESNGDKEDEEDEDKLYGGMVEDGIMMTGAEHDGWRSMKGLEEICRDVQAHYNEGA